MTTENSYFWFLNGVKDNFLVAEIHYSLARASSLTLRRFVKVFEII